MYLTEDVIKHIRSGNKHVIYEINEYYMEGFTEITPIYINGRWHSIWYNFEHNIEIQSNTNIVDGQVYYIFTSIPFDSVINTIKSFISATKNEIINLTSAKDVVSSCKYLTEEKD